MAVNECQKIRPTTHLHWADILTIVGYFVVVLLVGVWATVRARRTGDARGYFLAGKTMTFLPIGASIFTSNVGAPYFVGLAGTAAASGIGGIIFEWHAIPFILMLSWIFVRVFTASGVYTMPEYIRKRYGRERLRTYLSILSIILYAITKISVEIYAGAVFVQILLGWNMYLSGLLILAFSAVFTMTGGLTAVMLTDSLQAVVLVIGSFVLMIISLNKVGGYTALHDSYMKAVPYINSTLPLSNSTCGQPRADSFSLLRHPWTSDYPWLGTLVCNIPSDIWFWCSDQMMVQRALSAKNLSQAKAGSVVAGYLKVLPYFLFVIPGLAARVLFTDEVACVDPEVCQCVCENPKGCSNVAYPLLVLRVLNPGLRGLMLAALFAAAMSSLTSVFNSASSIFTMDLWRRIRKHASEWELLIVGRVVVLLLMGLAVVWIPIMSAAEGGELWLYWQMLISAVGPPWAMVFVFGIFWKRTTEPAAFYGMLGGQALGLVRLVLAFLYPAPLCGEPDTRHPFLKIHFLYVAAMEACLSAVLMGVLSLITCPRPPEKLRRMTLWTSDDPAMPELSDNEADQEDGKDDDHGDGQEDGEEVEMGDTRRSRRRASQTENRWSRRLRTVCGLTDQSKPLSAEEAAALQEKMTSLAEKPIVKKILDINAVILIAVCAFIIGYFK